MAENRPRYRPGDHVRRLWGTDGAVGIVSYATAHLVEVRWPNATTIHPHDALVLAEQSQEERDHRRGNV